MCMSVHVVPAHYAHAKCCMHAASRMHPCTSPCMHSQLPLQPTSPMPDALGRLSGRWRWLVLCRLLLFCLLWILRGRRWVLVQQLPFALVRGAVVIVELARAAGSLAIATSRWRCECAGHGEAPPPPRAWACVRGGRGMYSQLGMCACAALPASVHNSPVARPPHLRCFGLCHLLRHVALPCSPVAAPLGGAGRERRLLAQHLACWMGAGLQVSAPEASCRGKL